MGNITNGVNAAIIKRADPIIVFIFRLSIIPELIKMTPRNPKIIGIILEKIIVPLNTVVAAILFTF
ncbi:hypothetical protein [Methanobrevibacter filiformis]|uniref:Uncharacterized protein n=1 Tax=Methanobrevibacter filiformis TaxID=55758 RepID=A0A166CAE6_9EURY|nr:hypothetical protein [Methanobrevibacter filiformis]KZX12667.1 hypothetical protein MBFIL_10670 [Methanobrevibacter filiformis]